MKNWKLIIISLGILIFSSTFLYAQELPSCEDVQHYGAKLDHLKVTFDLTRDVGENEEFFENMFDIVDFVESVPINDPPTLLQNIDQLATAWDKLDWIELEASLDKVILDFRNVTKQVCNEKM